MPIMCTGGRARCFSPYCTARFTIVATLFQFSPYSRAVPFQLNSRANPVTVWAFKRNCFLIKVSMSTSVRIPSCSLIGTTNLNRCRGALQISIRPQAQVFQGLQLPLHFSERNQKMLHTLYIG